MSEIEDLKFAESRKLTPGERLELRMAAKAENKREKRAQRAPENDALEEIRRSWADVAPTVVLKRASALSGIDERELRRLIEEGAVLASQNRPGIKGSTLRISKESLIRYLAETIR